MGAAGLGISRAIIGTFFRRLEVVTAQSWAPSIGMEVKTDQESETYKWLGQVPAMREWIDGRKPRGFRENGITIVNRKFEATLEVDVDELRRDKTSQMRVRINELGERVAEHWAKLLTTLIVTPGNAYDGFGFFASNHLEGESGAQDNLLVAGDYAALNVTTPADPTPAEMKSAIVAAIGHMLSFKDDQGEPMNFSARQFMVMVPHNMWAATIAALSLPVLLEGGAAVSNLLASLQGFSVVPVVNPRLTATDAFYLFRTDASGKPFIMQEELFETGTRDDSFDNNRLLFGVKALRNVGTGMWQHALKATLS